MSFTTRNCDNCGKQYRAQNSDLIRGRGLNCSKECEALKREKKAQSKPKVPRAKATGLQFLEMLLKVRNIPYETEFRFLKGRQYRFDLAIPEKKIAIEYEGLAVSNKIGRHQTNAGYSNDCIKYNHAAVEGWKVLRFTAQNYEKAGEFLSILFP